MTAINNPSEELRALKGVRANHQKALCEANESIKALEDDIKCLAVRQNIRRGQVFLYHGQYYAIKTLHARQGLVSGTLERYDVPDLTDAE